MKTLLSAILSACLASCAGTTFYVDGERVAAFEGDMSQVSYTRGPDGTVTWTAETVDHSAATEAQGRATAGKVQAVGGVLAGAAAGALLNR